jgi:transglutaminase-like putative cysteine protease
MKKSNLLSLAAGLLLGAVIFGGVTAGAANLTQNIAATYRDIKIYIDRTLIAPKDANGAVVEPFIFNGTTYLPVRAVAEALGKEVSWDGGTNSVYIGAQPTATPTPNAEIPGGTAADYSLQANPILFTRESDRRDYNRARQAYLDTGYHMVLHKPVPGGTGEAALRQFVAALTGLSDMDKIWRINGFINDHLAYGEGTELSRTEFTDSFLTEGAVGKCAGYAGMFELLCQSARIPCIDVVGTVRWSSGKGGDHVWNEVYVDGKWRLYDGVNEGTAYFDADLHGATYTPDGDNDIHRQNIGPKEIMAPGSTI